MDIILNQTIVDKQNLDNPATKKPFRLFFVNLSDHLKVQQDGLRSLESRAILWRETIFQSGTSSRFQFDWNLVAEDDGKH